MTAPRILMCPPDHYCIEYEINAWMDLNRQVDQVQAVQQWESLRQILADTGATLEMLEPVKGLPDMVFTANAGLIFHDQVILSRFRPEQRRGEEGPVQAWFQQHGFSVRRLTEDVYFEGAGDALFCGDTLIAGYRLRSDALGQQQLGEFVGHRVIPLELVDPYYYHLDTCFCPLSPAVAMYHPGAFDDYGRRALAAAVEHLIEIQANEAQRFAANAVVVGSTVVTNTGCPQLHKSLRQLGYQPIETPLDEFVKAGGSAKCLTLRLDGEEAAAWNQTKPTLP